MSFVRIPVYMAIVVGVSTLIWTSPLQASSSRTSTLKTLDAAREALTSGSPGEAAELYQDLVERNPDKGSYWAALGSAHHSSRNYEAALTAWGRCVELGFRPRYMMYNLACAASLHGDLDGALAWIEKAYADGFVDYELIANDTDLDPLRDHPRFKEITGLRPDPLLDREAQWQRDIEFMIERMEQVHWDLYANVSRDEFLRRTSALTASVAEMSDAAILTEMRKIVVLAGDGHTSLRTPSNTVFPINLFWFEEGAYVRGAHEQNQDIIGKRVVAVGNQTIAEALESVEPLISRDNDMWIRQVAPGMIRNPIYMNVLGLTPSPDYLDLTVEDESGKRETVRVQAMPSHTLNNLQMMHNQLDSTPLYLQDRGSNYWFTHLEEDNLVYFQYNSVGDNPHGESIAEFTERLFAYIEEHAVDQLILDIRLNHGGNSFLNRPILQAIQMSRVNERGRLWVVAGRGTFSAAQNFASDLDFRTKALFVGEPTGSRANFVGETSIVVLPYSGTRISVSSRYHQHSSSNDYRFWIPADIAAPPTWASYAAGEDPALDAILAEVRSLDLPGGSGSQP